MWRRYACVRQSDQSDCGAAALATVALHHRRSIGLQPLRDLASIDRIGANLLGLLRAAETLGFSARGVKGTYDALLQAPLPAIAHVKTEDGLGHFMVLYRVKPEAVIVADPASGIRKLSRDAFCQCWTGYLLLIVPDPHARVAVSDGMSISPFRRFLGLLRVHTSVLSEAFFCALLMALLEIGASYFIQHLVDSVLVRHEGRLLNALGVGMVLLLLFRCLFAMLRQYLAAHVSRKVDLALIAGYARHILQLPLAFFETRRVGEILSRLNDIAKVREAISGTTLTVVVDGVLVVFLTAVLWFYDIPLALVATAFVPLLVLSAAGHHPAVRRGSRRAMENAAHLSAHLVEDISGAEMIKAFRAESIRAQEREMRLVDFVQSTFSLQKLSISMNAMGMFITAMAGIVVLWYGGHRVMAGELTIGQLMFCYSLLGYLLQPLERLASINVQLQDAFVAVDRLYQVWKLEKESLSHHRKATCHGVRHALELRDVSFRYGYRFNVIENVTLQILAGKTVAIVGESGSGKSTLLKLLMGFYMPSEGCILMDGVDIQNYTLASWRSQIGLVSQEPFIFNGALRDNIAIGRPDTTLEEIAEAAQAAGLEGLIASLPELYETVIGERGVNLSGGQRQRLAIARVLLRRPQLLIFDEATSHLDTATERAIQHRLKAALTGKTVVLVTHRLSTIQNADLIYVLHQGRIVQSGAHHQLLQQDGLYRTLWDAQTDHREGAGTTNSMPPNGIAATA